LGNPCLIWVESKTDSIRIEVFFEIDLYSAILLKKPRQELFIDDAGHESILKIKGVMRILVTFQERPMFSHIIQKVLARAFH